MDVCHLVLQPMSYWEQGFCEAGMEFISGSWDLLRLQVAQPIREWLCSGRQAFTNMWWKYVILSEFRSALWWLSHKNSFLGISPFLRAFGMFIALVHMYKFVLWWLLKAWNYKCGTMLHLHVVIFNSLFRHLPLAQSLNQKRWSRYLRVKWHCNGEWFTIGHVLKTEKHWVFKFKGV